MKGHFNKKSLYQYILDIKEEYKMSNTDKLILKMKRQPNGIKFQELAKVLEDNGYNMKPPKRNITSTFYK